jgi:hypothetical protein
MRAHRRQRRAGRALLIFDFVVVKHVAPLRRALGAT